MFAKRLGGLWLFLAAMCASHAEATEYVIDPQVTSISFKVRQFGMSEQTGEFSNVSGSVAFDAATARSTLEIALDSRSVRADNGAAQSILRGRRMLDVERYPSIAYSASHIDFAQGKPRQIDGVLTLRGTARPVALTVSEYDCAMSASGERCQFAATATFKRSDFGMDGFLGFISDQVVLAILGVAQARSE